MQKQKIEIPWIHVYIETFTEFNSLSSTYIWSTLENNSFRIIHGNNLLGTNLKLYQFCSLWDYQCMRVFVLFSTIIFPKCLNFEFWPINPINFIGFVNLMKTYVWYRKPCAFQKRTKLYDTRIQRTVKCYVILKIIWFWLFFFFFPLLLFRSFAFASSQSINVFVFTVLMWYKAYFPKTLLKNLSVFSFITFSVGTFISMEFFFEIFITNQQKQSEFFQVF